MVSWMNNIQRKNSLRYLAALRNQQARDILPVTLLEGQEQAQLGEKVKDDDTWTRVSGVKLEDLEQKLERAFAARTDIDVTSGKEHTI